tara:strand:+ start:668 stop:1294 length:627 start_codon:yes stop_codon:yes gene_type:complete
MVYASGLIAATSGNPSYSSYESFNTDRRAGLSTKTTDVTVGIDYSNNGDSYISGPTYILDSQPRDGNGLITDFLFQPTGYYGTGLYVSQGSLTAISGTNTYLDITGGAGSIANNKINLVFFKNEEPIGGNVVHYGEKCKGVYAASGCSSVVNKITYSDIIYELTILPQSQAVITTAGQIDTFGFVAGTGSINPSDSPKAVVSYTLFPL